MINKRKNKNTTHPETGQNKENNLK